MSQKKVIKNEEVSEENKCNLLSITTVLPSRKYGNFSSHNEDATKQYHLANEKLISPWRKLRTHTE